jgi:hypothetical protein
VISTGGEGGAYQIFAARYKDVLARYGITLVAKPSAGSTENLARLRDPAFEVDAAFIQAGTARPNEDDGLFSLGDFYHEPLWIFYREAALGSDRQPARPQGQAYRGGRPRQRHAASGDGTAGGQRHRCEEHAPDRRSAAWNWWGGCRRTTSTPYSWSDRRSLPWSGRCSTHRACA